MSSDIQAIQNQALGAVKQAEEDAFLETMRKKAEQQKIQQEHQRQKIQEFHRQDQQLQDTQKTQDQYKVELKAIEQAAKLLNIQPENLQPQNIKDVLPLLQQAEIEALQRILETQDLQNIQKRYKEAKLEDQGIKQKFSNELQLLQSISKALNIPVEKLTQGQIQAFLKKNKSEQFIPRKQQVNVNSKQLNSNDQLDRSSRVAARLTQLKGLLESLGSKQEEILRQMGQNKNLKRELDKVTQQIAKLDIKLNQLRDELLAKPDESQENILLKESVAAAKRDIQERRQ